MALLLLAGCEQREPPYQEQMYVFGTLADLSIWGVDEELAQRGANAIARDFQGMHREWHPWEPGPLTELNAAIAAGREARAPASLRDLIEVSTELSERSDGTFNPAIGRLVALWGFHSEDINRSRPAPPAAEVDALAAAAPRMTDLEVEGDVVRSRNKAVQLDFGAVAKGYAADLALRRLRSMGIDNALLSLGGGLAASGRHGDRPWKVGIRHPQGEGVVASLDLRDGESVHTSGNYERYNEDQGVRYSHIIDPRTGRPVRGIVSATVLHTDGATADAGATALAVAGPEDWLRIARRMGITHALLVDEGGTVYVTPAMRERVTFEGDMPEHVVVTPVP